MKLDAKTVCKLYNKNKVMKEARDKFETVWIKEELILR